MRLIAGSKREPGMTLKLMAVSVIAALPVIAGPVLAASAQHEGETITPAFREAIPNIPGKSVVGVVVSYAPGGKSPPHRHAASAFITAYVLSGAIRSQVNAGEVKVFKAGESWTEPPGAHHQISENASTTEPATLLAIFVADSKDTELTTFDQ